VRLGLKEKGISFHSFRHTVTTGLYHADVPEPIVKSIVGHEQQGVTQQHYFSSGYKVSQLRDALEKLDFGCNAVLIEVGNNGAGRGTGSVSLPDAE
jgi:integrase